MQQALPDLRVVDFAYDAGRNVTSHHPTSRQHNFTYGATNLLQWYFLRRPPPL
jgi:hypothetical protein